MLYFDEMLSQLGHNIEKTDIIEDMYTIIKTNVFDPEEMICLIDKI
jgi:hypothetical protein